MEKHGVVAGEGEASDVKQAAAQQEKTARGPCGDDALSKVADAAAEAAAQKRKDQQ